MSSPKPALENRSALLYRFGIGIGCTIFSLVLFARPELLSQSYAWDLPAAAIFFGLGTITRFFSFEAPERRITFTLDTPVYIAAVLTLGTVLGGLVCYISLLGYNISQSIHAKVIRRTDTQSWVDHLGRWLFVPGMTTTVLVLLSILIAPDGHWRAAEGGHPDLQAVYIGVPLLGVSFITFQYGLTAVFYFLKGVSIKRFISGAFLPGFFTEVALLPTAILMVLIYQELQLSAFLLLSVTYLFVNYVLRNLSLASAALTRQVRELAALNRLGQTICSTLERPELVARIAEETLDLFSTAGTFLLFWTDGPEGAQEHLDIYDRRGLVPDGFPEVRAGEIASEAKYSDNSIQRTTAEGSWLAVPVVVNDMPLGSLALWSPSPDTFEAGDMRFLTVVAQQAAIALENARLYELATVDSLTGLYVRRYFDDRLRDELARVRRYGGQFALFLIDVDYLKSINDTRGHQAGDLALIHVARTMRQGTRLVDVPARLGGDEFAVLLPNLDRPTAKVVAERLREQVAAGAVMPAESEIKVTVSIGVVCYPEQEATTVEELVAYADAALYEAKLDPERNRVAVYSKATESDGAEPTTD